ncbi:MAG TPA: universal stress protein [Woeseiaceae bacterium]|nr:universal stress protein [Woeseiaceae bacterium]
MGKIKHILVAVDQFPQSRPALVRAIELATLHNAKLTVVCIVDEVGMLITDVANQYLIDEQAMQLARERVEKAIRNCDLGSLSVDIRVDTGSASSRVVEIANHLGVDLIVLRGHQRRSIKEKLIGSTADRIIRTTPVSVLVIKRPVERGYRNVVIAVDFSEESESAAILSATICAGSEVRLVHFSHLPAQFEQSMLRAGSSSREIDRFRRNLLKHSRDRMRQLAERMAGRRPALRCRVVEGEPTSSLVKLTRSSAVDLIAVGPYEYGAIRLALLGSITQRLLREADCDVLISRPRDAGAKKKKGA